MYPLSKYKKSIIVVDSKVGSITVLGKIVDKATNQPVPSGSVSYSFSGFTEINVPVNSQGEFTFNIVPNQIGKNLYLKTFADGYLPRNDVITGNLIKGPEQIIIVKLTKVAVTEPDITPQFAIIYFPLAISKIHIQYKDQIKKIAAYLKAHPDKGIIISGYTSKVGGYYYNLKLSFDRAFSAYTALNQEGISKKRMIVKYFGYNKPAVPGAKTEAQRAKNRRVEFSLFKLGTLVVTEPKPPVYKAPKKKKYKKKKKKKSPEWDTKDYIIEDAEPGSDDMEVF
jgi:outer membrane protein OmpA-like peptidoglycan-associated protein